MKDLVVAAVGDVHASEDRREHLAGAFARLDDAADLDKPAIRALIAQAVKLSDRKITGPAQLIIQSISPKQRPRKPAAKPARATARPTSSFRSLSIRAG